MDRDTDLFPSSPTNSSTSSSDLDTMSTGSFFHDRSTTLGTLMGLTSPEIQARPSRPASGRRAAAVGGGDGVSGRKPKSRRSGCWRLCRGDVGPTSLEEFLRAERRLGAAEGDFLCGNEVAADGAGRLFLNGRVLPPAPASPVGRRRREGEAAGSLGRLPVMLAGICSGGEW
ncbi:hypothetical protein M5K25_005501 [Dendrobium thyrsiflorum]|uniref:Uncharacterized protein n=1 Tax=Dendrobium thyrsiflorum TaxID=117978 RepID=A0ABD0VPX3_DENTH